LIIDTVGSIVVVVDAEGRIRRFNAAGTRILGYQPEEVLGKVIWELFPPSEYRAMARERVERLLAGETMEFPCVWLTRDGQRRHLAFVCRGAPGPDGRIEYAIGSAIDITERVAAETALRESEQRFRTTFNDAAIGIALVDEKGRYLHVNRAYCELVEYEEHELLKMDLLSITHPDDKDPNWDLFSKVLNGEIPSYVFEKRYITRSGQLLWVQVSTSAGSAVPGHPATMIGLFENITERKRSRELLEQRVEDRTRALRARTDELACSEALLRGQKLILQSVLDSMGDGVYVADAGGQVIMMNPAAEKFTGLVQPGSATIAERARRPWFFRSDGVTPVGPEQLQLSRCARGEAMDDEEVLIRRPGYPPIYVSATGRPLVDESGKVAGAVLVVRDVTERKRNEAALREANTSLTESERHYRELADANLRLAREVEDRVYNHLQGLLGLVSLMRGRASNVLAFADAMEARLTAMRHVHELLAQAQWKPVPLKTLIGGGLATLHHMAPHSAEMRLAGPEVLICPRQVLPLTVVLVEWFTNSCKYGAHSNLGGRLEIRWELDADNGSNLLKISWTERGGPRIRKPVTPALGTEIVQSFIRRELAGKCELRYPGEGAEHVVEFSITGFETT
jgi:PAS domain S-box-containing protein